MNLRNIFLLVLIASLIALPTYAKSDQSATPNAPGQDTENKPGNAEGHDGAPGQDPDGPPRAEPNAQGNDGDHLPCV